METPLFLYKYQNFTQYSLQSLAENTVWMSSPASFNDPFDCAINLDPKRLHESVAHALEIIMKNAVVDDALKVSSELDEAAHAELRESLRAHMQKIGVLCLSETPEEILMWSHYAEYHEGFCIEFMIDDTCLLGRLAKPVKYTEIYPSLSLKNLPADAEESFIDVCVYTKAKQWSYEREWRALAPAGSKLYRAPAPISAIIFGARMPDANKTEIHQILHLNPGIQFKEAFLLEDVFGLGFHPYVASRAS